MTDTTVATDIHESLDVHLNGGTEFTFNLELTDFGTDCCGLCVIPVANLDSRIDAALLQDPGGSAAADSEDVGKSYITSFVVW
jgi:hypothetical protein